jgi:hypothetical protein
LRCHGRRRRFEKIIVVAPSKCRLRLIWGGLLDIIRVSKAQRILHF